MERYTATDVEQVSVVFDTPGGEDEALVDDYEPDASIEIEHGTGAVDQIEVGPDGAQVLHEMVQEDEFDIDVTMAH